MHVTKAESQKLCMFVHIVKPAGAAVQGCMALALRRLSDTLYLKTFVCLRKLTSMDIEAAHDTSTL